MAKIRIGFSTHFEVENELVGIGTDNPTNTKQVLGNIHATNTKSVGVSTFTTFDGFVDTKASISGLEGSEQGSLSGEIIIEGSATVSAGATFRSGPESLTVTDSFTLPGISDDKPTAGTTRFNENLGALEFYTGSEWRAVNSYVNMGNRGRGVFAAGVSGPAETRTIDYINIASQGNAINFGSAFPQVESRVTGTGNAIRGLFAGTNDSDSHDIIEYVTTASAGDAIDFGNLSEGRGTMGAAASSTRGIFMAGREPGVRNVIDYVEIMTTGNALDFGDCTEQASWVSCNN